jgi:hypothetical protein
MTTHCEPPATQCFDSPLRLWIAIWQRQLIYQRG